MQTLSVELLPLIIEFQPLFSKSVWRHAKLLLVGAIPAIGKRTIISCLHIMGRAHESGFQNYHRVLNRARWSALAASRLLLRLLVAVFAPTGELICGLDDTIERRRGQRIKAKGIYRNPVRSSHSHFVKASGLRWLCAMLLVEVPWRGAVWALPVLAALSPSAGYYQLRGRRHQKLTERAWQMIQLLARWLPERTVIFVADSSFAVLELLALVGHKPGVSLLTRLRLDAELWDDPPPRPAHQKGRIARSPQCHSLSPTHRLPVARPAARVSRLADRLRLLSSLPTNWPACADQPTFASAPTPTSPAQTLAKCCHH